MGSKLLIFSSTSLNKSYFRFYILDFGRLIMKLRILAAATLLSAIGPIAPAPAENIQHTQQLLATRQCPNCDLSGAGLVLANLTGANLKGADLSRANLSRANLSGLFKTATAAAQNLKNPVRSSSRRGRLCGVPLAFGALQLLRLTALTVLDLGDFLEQQRVR